MTPAQFRVRVKFIFFGPTGSRKDAEDAEGRGDLRLLPGMLLSPGFLG